MNKYILSIIFLLFLAGCTQKTALPTEVVPLNDGNVFPLTAEIVKKTIGENEFLMYGYNGQIPGPMIMVKQGSTITVPFTNNIDRETTVHWHGLRHANKDDGVPGVTQEPVLPGGKHEYAVSFPDAGLFWYHPHAREDVQQDLGLAGAILVAGEPPQVNKEEVLMLDDILIEGESIVPYGKDGEANYALMGRFGNTFIVNGKSSYDLKVNTGEVVRFYIVNAANTRTFNLTFSNARMKLVGADLSFYEREDVVSNIILSPGERAVVDALFTADSELIHATPARAISLGAIAVLPSPAGKDYSQRFAALETRNIVERVNEIAAPDYTFTLTSDMAMAHHMNHQTEEIEWEDSMPGMNKETTSKDITWKLVDKETGKYNMDFAMKVKQGDLVAIRLINDKNSPHPMQHPIHLHGQRFLVMAINGVKQENLAWKDTVLVPAGSTVDILVDASNPGEWMMHCHISEHLEAGMMTSLVVEPVVSA